MSRALRNIVDLEKLVQALPAEERERHLQQPVPGGGCAVQRF